MSTTYTYTCRNKDCPNKGVPSVMFVEPGEPAPKLFCGPCGGKEIKDVVASNN